MKRQSGRATLLTLLAIFHLPLTLVAGIFGTNIKEFGDNAPPFRLCFQALFAVIAVTLLFFGGYRLWGYMTKWLKGRRKKRTRRKGTIGLEALGVCYTLVV